MSYLLCFIHYRILHYPTSLISPLIAYFLTLAKQTFHSTLLKINNNWSKTILSSLTQQPANSSQPSPPQPKRPANTSISMQMVYCELRKQRGIAIPLIAMNLSCLVKITITTSFLGRLGELQLAGGTLAFTFANVTGFSVLNGLCGAMEPICGQAHGAKNTKLLHKTLLMATSLLMLTSLPIAVLWLNVDKILAFFGQRDDMIATAKTYLFYLLPSLVVTSFLCPLKAYLSSQGITVPIMIVSTLAALLHIPINIFLSKAKGLQGVSMAVWISDLITVVLLLSCVGVVEARKGQAWKDGGWFGQQLKDWITLLRLGGPCCLTTCLEWWCYEILVLLTGHLAESKEAVGVLAIVLNFDYLLYSVMLSLATSASIRISNQLGAGEASPACKSARVSLGLAAISGCMGALVMVEARGVWAPLFSQEQRVIEGARKIMVVMALVEVVNFPLVVSGGIIRGTARPWLGMYANLSGFYILALPLGVALGFKAKLGLEGLLLGFLAGTSTCLVLLLVFITRINWAEEAEKAQLLACDAMTMRVVAEEDQNQKSLNGEECLQV